MNNMFVFLFALSFFTLSKENKQVNKKTLNGLSQTKMFYQGLKK